MIRAETHSDDFVATARFDATPWFEDAKQNNRVEDVVELARICWGGDYAGDAVAQHVEDLPGYEAVANVLRHARDTDEMGFECHLDQSDAIVWLAENWPEALDAVALSQNEEPDVMLSVAKADASKLHWDEDPSWTGDYATLAAAAAPSA